MDGVLELSSDRRRKSGRCARANACQPKYWLNGDNERGGNAVRSEDHNGSGASMVYGCVLFLFHYRQSVGSENVLLLTGARREEIGGLRWSEIDFGRELITLSPERTKSRREFLISLSPTANPGLTFSAEGATG